MKKIILTLTVVISSFFMSCDNKIDTANVSKITNYPIITILGANPYFIQQGNPYVEPGATAVAGSASVPFTISGLGAYRGGTLDTNISDQYDVTYKAINSDGFAGTATRNVIVYKTGDLVNSIEGLYTGTVKRNGTLTAQYTNLKYVWIWKNASGTYEMSDGIGGYYNLGRAYGVGYAARPVKITANSIAANDFSVPNFSVGAFGGVAKMTGLTVVPGTKTITYTTTWDAGYTFEVTLKQVQP